MLLFDSTFQHVGRKHYYTKFLVSGLALYCTLGIFSVCLQCVDRMTDSWADRQIDRQSTDQEMLHNNLLAPVGFVFFTVDWPIPLGSTFSRVWTAADQTANRLTKPHLGTHH